MTPTRVSAVLMLALAAAAPVRAEDTTDIEQVRASTVQLINMLVEQGLLTRERADVLLAQATLTGAPPAPAPAAASEQPAPPPGTVRVPYIPEFVRKQMKDEIRSELVAQAEKEGWAGPGSVPEWTRRIQWYGDMRARAEFDHLFPDNAPAIDVTNTNKNRATTLLDTTTDERELRVRARAGFVATVDDHWSTDFRLVTGNSTSPVSSNQTLGDYNVHYTVALDRAAIRYRNGQIFDAEFGRIANPWLGTDLVWANDLSFDGLVVKWMPALGDNTRAFLTAAALPIQQIALTGQNKWLYGLQAGIDADHVLGQASAQGGIAFYDYTNTHGVLSPTGSALDEWTAPAFAQKGNTYFNISSDPTKPLLGLAADYRLLDLVGKLDLPVYAGKHFQFTADFVRNLAFNEAQVSARVGQDVKPKVNGFMLGAVVGDGVVARTGDWQLFGAYKYLERDAVMDAFTDSDFHLGGTDAKGYILGGSYGVGKNTAASLRVLSSDAISGPPLAIDVFQLDLTTKF